MKRWRLVALDLDGTLLDHEGNISNENQKWIKIAQQSGLEVTIATGRPLRLTKTFLELLDIKVPYVVANGSEVWAGPGQLLERHLISARDIEFVLQLALQYGTHFWSSVVDHVFPPGCVPDHVEQYQWLKFGLKSEDPMIIREIWNRLEDYGRLEVSSSDPSNIEVTPLGITKATGLRRVCQYMDINPEHVVTIGDGLNDVAMMQWSGLGIAMGNAEEQVKAIADRVTVHHTKHGVAEAIKILLYGEPHKTEATNE